MPEISSSFEPNESLVEHSEPRTSADRLDEGAARAVNKSSRRRRWRLGILLAINAGLAGVYFLSQLDPVTVKKYGPAAEDAYNLIHPSADPDAISPAGERLMAEITKRGGIAKFTGHTPGFLGLFARGDLFNVRFNRAAFGDSDLAELVKSTGNRMSGLDLRNTAVTDHGLRHLEGLSKLDSLVLGNWFMPAGSTPVSPITDAGLVHLKGLKQLRSLELNGLPITDSGLSALKDLPQLVSLDFSRTKIEGPGLARLKSLPRLATLYLVDSALTEQGLGVIAGASNLQVLWVRGVPLTGKVLQALKVPPKLNWVDLTGCGLLDEEVDDFKKSNPGLSILRQ